MMKYFRGILFYNRSTSSLSKDDQPYSYNLEQNYPNPFNPASIINYQLAEPCFANITVYNTLGIEIAKLINEEKPAGSFSVEFVANALSSGIYFYKIQTAAFVKTKKMLLLK